MTQTTVSIPSTQSGWASLLDFKTPQDKDTVGLVNMNLGRGARIELISSDPSDMEPISAQKVNLPMECFTLEDFHGKGKSQMTIAIELTPFLWKAFNALDKCFDAFLVTHASKLFSKQDAEYIKKDPSSIALKRPKPLARFNPDGSPKVGGFMSLRVTGRGDEVQSIDVKDGPKGQYVGSIKFSERLTFPIASATRFAKVKVNTGTVRTVCTTLPRDVVKTGEPRTRIVGPGDFQGGLLYGCNIVVSHWALVNGSASLCIKAVDVIFMNSTREIELPSGFVVDNEVEEAEEEEKREEPAAKRRALEFSSVSKPKAFKTLVDRPGKLTEKETELNFTDEE